MNGSNFRTKWLLVLGLTVIALLVLFPNPGRKLKGGIDLVGGTSLMYEIDTTGLDPNQQDDLAARVMEVLKQRVDPGGQRNLEWRPMGNTRLEIRMPMPTKEALARRRAYNAAKERIERMSVSRMELIAALSLPPEERAPRLAELERGVEERGPLFAALVNADQALRDLPDSATPEERAQVEGAFEDALAAAVQTSLPIDRLEDVFNLGPGPNRKAELEKLEALYPSYASGTPDEPSPIASAMAAYDLWAQDKADLEDPADLKRLLRGAGVLEFVILAERDQSSPRTTKAVGAVPSEPISKYEEQLSRFGPRPRAEDRYRWMEVEDILDFFVRPDGRRMNDISEFEELKDSRSEIYARYAGRYYVLAHNDPEYEMSARKRDNAKKWKLAEAFPNRDPMTGRNVVHFRLDPRGGSLFSELTGTNVDRQLCIVLDGKAMSHANIGERIGASGQISGNFSNEQVQYLVRTLEAGALPARLKEPPLREVTIGPSLGEANRAAGMRAAVWGVITVAVFVLIYYGIAGGGMANVALAMNLLFVLAAMALMQATFTLPGIAGLILTVGMAIDANVLIFERFREERERGAPFKRALNAGYDKAFSTILDANLTTLITCVILGVVSSEEVKGFATVLGIGIVASMFTSLVVTRLAFNTLIAKGWLGDLRMMQLIKRPSVDWLSMRRKFWPISAVLVLGGVSLFTVVSQADKEAIFDIEFLGGTSVQVDFKTGVERTERDVKQAITGSEEGSAVDWLTDAAEHLGAARIEQDAAGTRFTITSAALNGGELASLMRGTLRDDLIRNGVNVEGSRAMFDVRPERGMTLETFRGAVSRAVTSIRKAADNMRKARVIRFRNEAAGEEEAQRASFEISTVEEDRGIVQSAVLAALGEDLDLQRAIRHRIVTSDELADEDAAEGMFVIRDAHRFLSDVLPGVEAKHSIVEYKGGVAIHVALPDDETPQTIESVQARLDDVRLHPGADYGRARREAVFPLGPPTTVSGGGQGYRAFAVVAVDDQLHYASDRAAWRAEVAENQLAVVRDAFGSEGSLSKVVQFAGQIARQTQQNTVFAVILALGATAVYIWFRFGTMHFGLAAIVALVHDVSITLGAITLSHYIYATAVGRALGVSDFKIDLPMIAALLTVIGYSLNDTIVVFDRIRENRGRLGDLSPNVINNSINQTLSRTVLTSMTTFVVVLIMYIFGGAGIAGFSYALLIGILVGTYSSIAIAAPLLYNAKALNIVSTALAAVAGLGVVLAITDPADVGVRVFLGAIALALVAWWGVWLNRKLVQTGGAAAAA